MEKQLFDCFKEKLTLDEICEKYPISKSTLLRRRKTMSIEDAIRSVCNIDNDPTSLVGVNLSEVERENGLAPHTLGKFMRRHKGLTLYEGVEKLKSRRRRHYDKTYTNENGEQESTSIKEFAKKVQLGEDTVYRYLRKGYSLDQIMKKAKERPAPYSYHTRKVDEQVDDNLDCDIVQDKGQDIMYDREQTLRQYCIQNGYNYRVIASKIEKRMSVDEAISEYVENGQRSPRNVKYEYYGILLKSLLLHYQLDTRSVINLLNDGFSLIDSISIAIFHTGKRDSHMTTRRMYELYQRIVTLPEEERYSYLLSQPLKEEESVMFETKYNRLEIIKRDLAFIAFYMEHKEDESVIKETLSTIELQYVENLVNSFSIAECREDGTGELKSVQYYQKTFEKTRIG